MKNLEMDELAELITLLLQTPTGTHFSPLVVADVDEGVLSHDHGELHLGELLAQPSHKIDAAELVITMRGGGNGNLPTGDIHGRVEGIEAILLVCL